MAEKYYLMPGNTIGKKGLPGGKLECKKDSKPLKIEDKYAKIIEKNIGYLVSAGILKTANDIDAVEKTVKKRKVKAEPMEQPELSTESDPDKEEGE